MSEMEMILQAQMSRGYESDTKNPVKKLMIVIPLAIPLLVSSVKKTERMAVSMEARGFGAGPRSSFRKIDMTVFDYSVLTGFATAVCISAILVFA
jgi:energy-coupling factor transport system permease protein